LLRAHGSLKIALVLVRLDHVASFIVNTNHGIFGAAVEFRVVDSVARGVWLVVPQPTERQRIGRIEALGNNIVTFPLLHAVPDCLQLRSVIK